MRKQTIISNISFFVILIILCANISIINSIESPTVINDFSGFTVIIDSADISSTNTNSQISMIFDDEPSVLVSWEHYLLNLTESENFTDFNLKIHLDYEYTGSMLMQAGISLNSHYFENGTIDENSYSSISRICACGIWDAWAASEGKCYVSGRPYGVEQQFDSAYGSISKDDDVYFLVSRVSNVLNITIAKGNSIIISHIWTEGVSRYLNAISLVFSVDPNYCVYTELNFDLIEIELFNNSLSEPTTPPITPTNSTSPFSPSFLFGFPIYTIGFSIFASLIVLIYIKKIKK